MRIALDSLSLVPERPSQVSKSGLCIDIHTLIAGVAPKDAAVVIGVHCAGSHPQQNKARARGDRGFKLVDSLDS